MERVLVMMDDSMRDSCTCSLPSFADEVAKCEDEELLTSDTELFAWVTRDVFLALLGL